MEKEQKEQVVQAENVQTETIKPKQEEKEKKESKTSGTLLGKDSTLKWVVAAAIFVIAAIIIAVTVYFNNPTNRAKRALELGERYLLEQDYEGAIVQFTRALELDPRNEEIAVAIYGHLDDLLVTAQDYGETNNYSAEREIAALVLRFDAKNSQGDELLVGSLPEDKNGRELFDRANDLIRDADKGDSYLSLLDLCEQGDWQGVAEYIDSAEFDPIADYMDVANPQYASRDVDILITQKDDCYIVITGDWIANGTSGYGTAVISSANTYAIYEGEWKDSAPDGDGVLRVWYKNQAMEDGIQYSGSFEDGLVNGEVVLNALVNGTAADLDISVSSGSVKVFTTDEGGRVWLYDAVDNGTYIYIVIVDSVKEYNGTVADYNAGVPGYGGSDDVISVYGTVLDLEPPVLECSLEIDYWYEISEPEIPIGDGITAIDNVDGDITDRITSTSTKGPTDWQKERGQDYDDHFYILTVIYSATDAAGNVGTLTVVYEFDTNCGDYLYKVVSVN